MPEYGAAEIDLDRGWVMSPSVKKASKDIRDRVIWCIGADTELQEFNGPAYLLRLAESFQSRPADYHIRAVCH